MSEQQYRVVADRDKGDDPTWNDVEVGDLVVSRTTAHPQHGAAMVKGVDMLIRVERPVPNTDEPQSQIAEARKILLGIAHRKTADPVSIVEIKQAVYAVLAILQNGADQ